MLTSLDFLNIGESFPPESEVERLQMYRTNKLLFEGKHELVYEEQFKRIQRVIGNFEQVISYAVLANFQKLISLKIADLLLGEEPNISAGDNGSKEQLAINTIKENTDLTNTAYQTVIDVSRYGDGLFLIYKDANYGMIDVTQPSIWFPVVDPNNIKRIVNHVLAWKVGNVLTAQIHYKGKYEENTYTLESGIIKKKLNTNTYTTGLNDFAVIQVPNTITSDRVHGLNDYDDIDSLLSELEVRLSQIAKVLDKHTEPSLQGPASALYQDAKTGEWKLKMGNYFPMEKEDGEVKYLTWDAQLTANIQYIEKIINLLYTISEMGSAIFGDLTSQTGSVPSGSALRRLMISPLAKVNRIRMRFDPAMKKAIKLCSQLGGKDIVNLSDIPVSIIWKDGLPGDPKEEAEIMQIRTGNKATLSQKTAIKRYDNLSDEDAQTELDTITEDENKLNPVNSGNFPFSDNNTNVE